jgi:hypothetical protein
MRLLDLDFLALSSLIVNAYLRDGHGTWTMTSLTYRLFILAAVLYVDDPENIHMMAQATETPKELIEHAQNSTNAWGGLAIATGTAMKPEYALRTFLFILFPMEGSQWAPLETFLHQHHPSHKLRVHHSHHT